MDMGMGRNDNGVMGMGISHNIGHGNRKGWEWIAWEWEGVGFRKPIQRPSLI